MESHEAGSSDLDLLAEWNRQLIQDEGHRNRMSVSELRERMRQWLCGEYRAIIFTVDAEPLAYALYKENESEIYLRQFFVRRDRRREGIGRAAISWLRSEIWPTHKRMLVEVLAANPDGTAFWRAVGYRDYCITLEIMPPSEQY